MSMKQKLRFTPGTQNFKLPGEEGLKRIHFEKGNRRKDGTMQVYVCPVEGNRIWMDRGYWVDWDTEVTWL